MAQASFAIISSFRSTGVLMVLAFLVIPPIWARLFCHRLKSLLLAALLMGPAVSLISVALARHLLTVEGIALSTSGLVVVLLASTFLVTATIYYSFRKWAKVEIIET